MLSLLQYVGEWCGRVPVSLHMPLLLCVYVCVYVCVCESFKYELNMITKTVSQLSADVIIFRP